MRGDIHHLNAPRSARGHEQQGRRFAVVLQSDDLMLSTRSSRRTSRSATPSSFRPTVDVDGERTQVLVEQTAAVDPSRLGPFAGRLAHDEMVAVDEAIRLVLELD